MPRTGSRTGARLASEQDLIGFLRKKARFDYRRVQKGIGDDCAVFRPSNREDLVSTTDMLMEDVHSRRDTPPPAAVGHKALARSLSDLAAMGARPRFSLLSLALPDWADMAWVERFYDGYLKLAHRTE